MTTEKKVAPSRKRTTGTVVPKAEQPTKRTTRTVSTRTASKAQATKKETVVRTQARKASSPSAASKTPQKRVITVEKITISKSKMERDSFTMPKDEYKQLSVLKKRLAALGQPAKKSELLRAGIQLLAGMTDARLKTTMATVPVIKTGRPRKKK